MCVFPLEPLRKVGQTSGGTAKIQSSLQCQRNGPNFKHFIVYWFSNRCNFAVSKCISIILEALKSSASKFYLLLSFSVVFRDHNWKIVNIILWYETFSQNFETVVCLLPESRWKLIESIQDFFWVKLNCIFLTYPKISFIAQKRHQLHTKECKNLRMLNLFGWLFISEGGE